MVTNLYTIFKSSKGVNTDTRTLERDQLYVALKGENFDGNLFIEQAFAQGALHVLTSDDSWVGDDRVTVVPDTLIALQELSTHHRKQLSCPIVALTGSNGKTTTKELIISVLQTQYKVQGTVGNLNNHIGVPLTLLSFHQDTEIGIVEMGANHQKEIEFLCSIALPDYGMITNYGKAHLEGFGGLEGVVKGKSEMYDYLRNSENTAIVGRWDLQQLENTKGVKRVLTIEKVSLINSDPYVALTIEGVDVVTQLTGDYNYNNVLFAASIGKLFNVTIANIKKGLESYKPANNRSQIIKIDNATIILDAYNANPSSMEVALTNLSRQNEPYKVAILGDMFELGAYSLNEHQLIADLANSLNLDAVFLIGKEFSKVKTDYNLFASYDAFNEFFNMDTSRHAVYLIKGSRGMRLERILQSLNKN